MRILAVVSYNGTNYQGWQKQPNGMTVQERLEIELSKVFNRPIKIYGSGRTDAGVHALGQTFHFDVDVDMIDIDRLIYSLNCMLPEDIKIENMEEVDEDFHARFSATEKIYSYAILLQPKNPLFYQIMYTCPYKLDLDLMDECLTHFIGEHNFKNFTSKESDEDGFIRNIFDIEMDVEGDSITILFHGNGFMRYMIRFIVGAAIEVARGNMNLEEIDSLLDDSSERNIVSCKAPACGLTLLRVIYENL